MLKSSIRKYFVWDSLIKYVKLRKGLKKYVMGWVIPREPVGMHKIMHEKVWENLVKCVKSLKSMRKYEEIWESIIYFGKVWASLREQLGLYVKVW